jgi:hypothetical protein
MSTAAASYPVQLGFEGGLRIARWRPLVQWVLGIPQLLIAGALEVLRGLLTLISFFTVLVTGQIPRPIFDMIAMTYRYEWRAASYALFLREDYPPITCGCRCMSAWSTTSTLLSLSAHSPTDPRIERHSERDPWAYQHSTARPS